MIFVIILFTIQIIVMVLFVYEMIYEKYGIFNVEICMNCDCSFLISKRQVITAGPEAFVYSRAEDVL